ncbi:hypothetical protein GCM10010260_30100 [Streptomyces filipinensis]|uniref:Uncharacterized protein n=1 Tax=Streptomyces filipinensis TaxID=66887 RepID=A0A918MAB6_9ACTN|nr:hypothetical protein [Streptomyces filipinensis]GGU93221.1 hypothetical protein GCM10010260_30100 [Streptomyces filipinensis]
MVLLAEHDITATPGRCVVEVYDADAYLGDEAALDAAETQVVAGNGYHLYLLSLQPDMTVQVTIRIWDSPPTPPANAEGHTAITLESETGTLVIGQLDRGPADEITLPRPGVYEGHAWWEGRTAAADYYGTTLDQLSDDSSEDILLDAWDNNPVIERYVLDLAYTREPELIDDEEL